MALTVQRPTAPTSVVANATSPGGGNPNPLGTGAGGTGDLATLLPLLFSVLGSQGFGGASSHRQNSLLDLLLAATGAGGATGKGVGLNPGQGQQALRSLLQLGNEPGAAGAGGQR